MGRLIHKWESKHKYLEKMTDLYVYFNEFII